MGEAIDRIIPVNKPIGISTYDIIRQFRRRTGYKGKIGHGGTLDPFATGVVLLLLGRATSRFEEIQTWAKKYYAGIRLGATSSTLDITGLITVRHQKPMAAIDMSIVEKTINEFTGRIDQKIPAYSAAKHEGKPLYRLAREGISVEKSKIVEIHSIQIMFFKPPILTCRVSCGSGVYIRQLAHDIGEKIGCGGFLYYLEREQVGNYSLRDCLAIEDFSPSLVPIN